MICNNSAKDASAGSTCDVHWNSNDDDGGGDADDDDKASSLLKPSLSMPAVTALLSRLQSRSRWRVMSPMVASCDLRRRRAAKTLLWIQRYETLLDKVNISGYLRKSFGSEDTKTFWRENKSGGKN